MKQKIKNIIFLVTLGLSSIGEWIYFIALNLMILGKGGTAADIAMLYIIRPIADIITNMIFSNHIDRFNKKNWLFILNIISSFLVGLLLVNQNILFVSVLVFLLQVCRSLYEPISLGYIVLLVPKNKLKKFNAWNSIVSSGGFLIGPALAGVLVSLGSPLLAIGINAVLLLVSGFLILLLPYLENLNGTEQVSTSYFSEVVKGLRFLKKFISQNKLTIATYFLVSSMFIVAAGLDSVEAAFSKMVLLMSDSEYGLLVSISGAGYLFGAFLLNTIIEKISERDTVLIGAAGYVLGYLLFTLSTTYLIAAFGVFLISFALAFINTGFRTFVQVNFPSNKIGQLTTALGVLNSIIEIGIVSMVGILVLNFDMRYILIIMECIMVFIVIVLIRISKKVNFK